MILEEIELGEDNESKRKAILNLLGEQVILYDNHNRLVHGRLSSEVEDDEVTYGIEIADPRGYNRFFYHDLKGLVRLIPHKNYPLPKIRIE